MWHYIQHFPLLYSAKYWMGEVLVDLASLPATAKILSSKHITICHTAPGIMLNCQNISVQMHL